MKYDKLTSKRLEYTQFKESDYNDLFDILGNDNVCKYLPGEKTFGKEDVTKWLNFFVNHFTLELPNLIYALRLKGTDKVIGYVGLAYVKEYKKNEVMYAFNEDFWNKGYASESAFKMLDLAKELNIEELIAFADVDNTYSEKVLLKLGYKYIETIELWGLTMKYFELKTLGN